MVNNQLLEYIEAELKDGASRETVITTLHNVGWVDADIREAFQLLGTPISPKAALLTATDYHDAEAAPFQSATPSGPLTQEEIARAVEQRMKAAAVSAEPSASVQQESAAPVVSQISSTDSSPAAPAQDMPTDEAAAGAPSQGPTTSSESEPVSEKSGHPWIMAGAIAGSLLLVAGSVAGYVYFWRASAPPLGAEIGALVFKNLSHAKSFTYDGVVSADISYDSQALDAFVPQTVNPLQSPKKTPRATELSTGRIAVHIKGSQDLHDSETQKSLTNWSFDVKTGGNPAVAFAFAAESRSVGEVMYIKLSNVPFLSLFGGNSLQNQWLLIDPTELVKNLDTGALQKYQDQVTQKKRTDAVVRQNLLAVLGSRSLLSFRENPERADFNSIPVYKYHFAVNTDELFKALVSLAEMNSGARMDSATLDEIDRMKAYIQFKEGELWVGREDLLPYRLLMKGDVEESKTHAFAVHMEVDMSMQDYDKPLEIIIPSDAKPLDEVLSFLRPPVIDTTASSSQIATSTPLIPKPTTKK